MSHSITLRAAIAVFLGDAEGAVNMLADTLAASVSLMLQHGTKAPVDDAIKVALSVKGSTVRVRALRAGFTAVYDVDADKQASGILCDAMGKAGKVKAQDKAQEIADTISSAFTLAAVEVMTAQTAPKAKAKPAVVAARAIAALAALTDAQFGAAIGANEWADLMARADRLQAVKDAAELVKYAKRGAAIKAPVTDAAPVTA